MILCVQSVIWGGRRGHSENTLRELLTSVKTRRFGSDPVERQAVGRTQCRRASFPAAPCAAVRGVKSAVMCCSQKRGGGRECSNCSYDHRVDWKLRQTRTMLPCRISAAAIYLCVVVTFFLNNLICSVLLMHCHEVFFFYLFVLLPFSPLC